VKHTDKPLEVVALRGRLVILTEAVGPRLLTNKKECGCPLTVADATEEAQVSTAL
jgi:hypothetical protein